MKTYTSPETKNSISIGDNVNLVSGTGEVVFSGKVEDICLSMAYVGNSEVEGVLFLEEYPLLRSVDETPPYTHIFVY